MSKTTIAVCISDLHLSLLQPVCRADKVKDIPGFDGFYKISSEGRVWSCRVRHPLDGRGAWKEKQAKPDVDGYPRVRLTFSGKAKDYSVHRLVLLTFKGPCPPGKQSRHLNSKAGDCRATNLEWSTQTKNQHDRFANGTHCRGENSGLAKLTWVQVRKMKQKFREETSQLHHKAPWQIFAAYASDYGVTRESIANIIQGKTWKE